MLFIIETLIVVIGMIYITNNLGAIIDGALRHVDRSVLHTDYVEIDYNYQNV